MKKYLISLLIIFSSQSCLPTVRLEGAITFQKTFGADSTFDYGKSVQQTTDGGYIVAGGTCTCGPVGDIYLIKTDSLGDTLWTKTYGGNNMESGSSVRQCLDNGFIIAGFTASFNDTNPDVYLIRTNPSGDTIWTKTYGTTIEDYGFSVLETQDGKYVIGGATYTSPSNSYDVYLIKTNPSGDTLWTKTYGGSEADYGYSIQQTQDGGYIIAGKTESFGAGYYDVYLIKTDSIGDTIWTKTYGDNDYQEGLSIQQTEDNGFIIVGETEYFGTGNIDIYLIKTDSSGDTLWTRTYGGSNQEIGNSVQQTTDGGYIIAGRTGVLGGEWKVYIIKTNSIGDVLWTRTYGDTGDEGYSVQQTTDGGFIIAGYTNSFGTGYNDVYLIKTDSSGNVAVEESSPRSPLPTTRFSVSPNPFTTSTTIQFSVSRRDFQVPISLNIFDLSGKLVESTDNPILGKNLKSGIYFVRINNSQPIKITKIK